MSEKEKACLEVLIEAGCSEEWARGFLSLWKEGKVCEAMRILTERRRELLEKLHTDQRQLDCLDYFIYQMKKEARNMFRGGKNGNGTIYCTAEPKGGKDTRQI